MELHEKLYWVSEIRTSLICFLKDCVDKSNLSEEEAAEELEAYNSLVYEILK
jgi:hypothetical protein